MVGLEIYFDLLFLSVFIWNACTFFLTNQALGRVANPFRIWMSALSGAVIFTGILFLPLKMLLKGVLWIVENLWNGAFAFPREANWRYVEGFGSLLDSKRALGRLRAGIL